MTTTYLDVDGIRIAYTDKGSGVPVLLMHGNPDSRHSWEPVMRRLGDGVRSIAPDFPGFCDSAPLPDNYDLLPNGMAALWNSFVDGVGLKEPVVVAVHDFGGPWLLSWVAAHSDRVRGVLIMNTAFHSDFQWSFWPRIWQRRWLGELSMALTNRWLLRREMRRASPELSIEIIDATYERIHPTMKRTVLRVYRAYANAKTVLEPWEGRLREALSSIPTRVIWGDLDPFIAPEFADRYRVQATHLSEYGHWHHISNPNPVAQTLLELAGRVEPITAIYRS